MNPGGKCVLSLRGKIKIHIHVLQCMEYYLSRHILRLHRSRILEFLPFVEKTASQEPS
jgi:hypothetical protein